VERRVRDVVALVERSACIGGLQQSRSVEVPRSLAAYPGVSLVHFEHVRSPVRWRRHFRRTNVSGYWVSAHRWTTAPRKAGALGHAPP
jgi:hypothetical protein